MAESWDPRAEGKRVHGQPSLMAGPLQGIRVLDLTSVIAGPYATQMLGDLGADVVKVETAQGDIMRWPGPARSPGMGAAFLNCNRNKTSIVLDLKAQADHAAFMELADKADVFVHNMRPAAAARLGLSYADLQARNPDLIYCAIVGFGQDGPYRDRPAYDDVIQAASGWASLEWTTGGEPRYAPTIVADKTAALFAASAINAALLHRERVGEGQYIEVPMYEVMVSFLLVEHLGGRTFSPAEGPAGYSRLMSQHRRPYRTKDGHISVLPYTAAHWKRFFVAAEREDWASDQRLTSDSARSGCIDELYQRVSLCLPNRTSTEWINLLTAEDVPCSRVNSIDDLLADEHLKAVNFFSVSTHPTEGDLVNIRPPVLFSRTPCEINLPPPDLVARRGQADTRSLENE